MHDNKPAKHMKEQGMPDHPNIQQALVAVMTDVGAVRKTERNEQQRFVFRGIDTVVKAVYPAFVRHGVIVVPHIVTAQYGTIEIGAKRTPMGHARVVVDYTFHGPAGDTITARVAAEAMDSGDKAHAKAMSVALRTALLQTLMLPTDEPDPDSQSYERSYHADTDTPPAPQPTVEDLHARLERAAAGIGTDVETLTAKFRREHDLTMDQFLALPSPSITGYVNSVEEYIARAKKSEA